jgi:hypothetical protein
MNIGLGNAGNCPIIRMAHENSGFSILHPGFSD